MKAFGGEGLGRPERESKFVLEDASRFFKRSQIDLGAHSPEAVMVFTNNGVNLQAEDSKIPAVQAAKLKEFIRKKAKSNPVSDDLLKKIESSIQI